MFNGGSNRQIYDTCSYQKKLHESTQPLQHIFYFGKHENCNKCRYEGFPVKYQSNIVDLESELKNLTRPLSNCDEYQYNPNCKKSGLCTSTFYKGNPIVFAPEICPIVYNNIPKQTHPGYRLPNINICNL